LKKTSTTLKQHGERDLMLNVCVCVQELSSHLLSLFCRLWETTRCCRYCSRSVIYLSWQFSHLCLCKGIHRVVW